MPASPSLMPPLPLLVSGVRYTHLPKLARHPQSGVLISALPHMLGEFPHHAGQGLRREILGEDPHATLVEARPHLTREHFEPELEMGEDMAHHPRHRVPTRRQRGFAFCLLEAPFRLAPGGRGDFHHATQETRCGTPAQQYRAITAHHPE